MNGMGRMGWRVAKTFGVAVVVGVCAVLALLSRERRSELILPRPSGPFPVGRVNDVVRLNAPDALAPVPGTKRELIVWMWYPSAASSGSSPREYLPAPWRDAFARHLNGPFKFVTRDLSVVRGWSTPDAAVAPEPDTFPVVILRGGASANVTNYSTLAEDLASHGYVVVGIDAPYRTNVVMFPDGRVVTRTPENNPERCVAAATQASCITPILQAWTADMALVLDRLEQMNRTGSTFRGRLDMTRVGVFGHSLGGAEVAQFCHEDARCKVGIDVDGALLGSVIQAGLHQPFMFLVSAQIEQDNAENRQVIADIRRVYDHLPPNSRALVEIRGANHFMFSDDGALLKSQAVRGLLRLFGQLGIDGRRQLAVTAYCVERFFDTYLKGGVGARLDLSSPLYPEVLVLQ
jgi:dienelactone hydrolase